MEQLESEASAFLYDCLNFKLGDPIDRLRVPVIETVEKSTQQEANTDLLALFIRENIHMVDGHTILFEEFYDRFMLIVPRREQGYWTMMSRR